MAKVTRLLVYERARRAKQPFECSCDREDYEAIYIYLWKLGKKCEMLTERSTRRKVWFRVSEKEKKQNINN